MPRRHSLAYSREYDIYPAIRTIGVTDLKDALTRGVSDFWAMPSQVMYLFLIYPFIGLLLGRLTFGYELLPLLYPLIVGFAVIGPLTAVGLYEMSRRRERGLEVSWADAFNALNSHTTAAIVELGAILMVIFITWLVAALTIYNYVFTGTQPTSLVEFMRDVITTPAGWTLIVVGNGVGFILAFLAFSISVVSLPMILDRDVSAATAIRTSVRAVRANPRTMTVWAFIIGTALIIGCLPLFLGLTIMIPVLGHASWHLYRKTVAR